MDHKLNQEEIQRYSRHLLLPQVGVKGQEKLKDARVLIVGTGGLGSPISMYLAAAGIGHLGLVDFDVVDLSNLQRQVVHGTAKIGVLKVNSAAERLRDMNPFISIEIFNEYLSAENIERIAAQYEIIVDGTDNFASRYLINDYCVLNKKIYIYGSIYRFEGQVSVFDAQNGPCYRCMFPVPPPAGLTPACGEGGVFGVLPGTVGTLQATKVITHILGLTNDDAGKLYLYDALDFSLQEIKLRKNPKCKVCGENPEITTLADTAHFCEAQDQIDNDGIEVQEISVEDFQDLRARQGIYRLIDVRDPIEAEIFTFSEAENFKQEDIQEEIEALNPNMKFVFFCRNGIRSKRVVRKLQKQGFDNVYNLTGGTNAWVKKFNDGKFVY